MSEPTPEEFSKTTLSLGRSTNVQLWLAIIISIALCGWVVRDQTWKTRVDMRLVAIEKTVNASVTGQWTKTEMKLWVSRAINLNPDLHFPIIE
ncbi:MAG: hypothetical protein QQN63_01640 [Nitrosopumilus sp.]